MKIPATLLPLVVDVGRRETPSLLSILVLEDIAPGAAVIEADPPDCRSPRLRRQRLPATWTIRF